MATTTITTIEKLNSQNYETWSIFAENALHYNNLWKYLQTEKPDDLKDWKALEARIALSFFYSEYGKGDRHPSEKLRIAFQTVESFEENVSMKLNSEEGGAL